MTTSRFGSPTNGAGSSASAVATVPTSVPDGALLIARIGPAGGSSVTITPPGGWTFIQRHNDTTVFGVAEYWKLALSESGGYTWPLGSSVPWISDMVAYLDYDQSNPISIFNGQANGSSANVDAPSITTLRPNTMVLYYGGTTSGGATFTPPTGFTEILDANGTEIAEQLIAVPGATGTVTGVASGAAVNCGQIIAINPQPVPPILLPPPVMRAMQATLRM